jgi:hypothetical protein
MRDFHHSVNVAVQAYINGTLEHMDCQKCYVGNLIRASGYNLKMNDDAHETYWLRHLQNKFRKVSVTYDLTIAMEQIVCTGYTDEELNRLEYAFEFSEFDLDSDQYMFNGMMAVVEELAKIHNIDLETTEKAKALFVK